MDIYKLSDNLGATYDPDDGSVTLYDTSGKSPIRREYLNSGGMVELMNFYVDGSCPVCLEEIPLNDIICNSCLRRAQSIRAGKGMV